MNTPSRRTRLFVITCITAPALFAQQIRAQQTSSPTVVASDPPGLTAPPPNDVFTPVLGLDGGPVAIVDVAFDDSMPLPVPRRVEARDGRDVVVAPASGDPFFLSFSAGTWYPPADERLDPELAAQAWLTRDDGRPERVTWGYAMLSKRITPQRIAEIEHLGVRVLGIRPFHNLIVALRPEQIAELTQRSDVRWIGLPRPWQKIHPALAATLAGNEPTRTLDVWVAVFEPDESASSVRSRFGEVAPAGPGPAEPSPENPDARPWTTRTNGWQERAIERTGAVALDYAERSRAFLVRANAAEIAELVAADFVQAIDLRSEPSLADEESIPMVQSDIVRATYDGSTNSAAIAGLIDSGFDLAHVDLDQVFGAGWSVAGGTNGPWVDYCWHGTHVGGILLGAGDGQPGMRGNAPGLGWGPTGRLFFIRTDGDTCGSGHSLWTMQSLINIMRQPAYTTPKPHMINCSWGKLIVGGVAWDGTETEATQLDTAVYSDDQSWIFASGNEGPNGATVRMEGSAKDVLTVGSVLDYRNGANDPGDIVAASSRGPTLDGRWKPNLCAPGELIDSCATNTGNGYLVQTGTSMATPHVTGIAAQLVDAFPWLRYAPARLSSLLMATAITRNDVALTSPSDLHLRQYGAGRVDAYRALWNTNQFVWTNWGFTLNSGQATAVDFNVGAGATRLVVCMHYVEPPNPIDSGIALRSNFDLYLDQAPIDPAMNTGDWLSQQSSVDNTEIRTIDAPQAGAWRWKIWPQSTVSPAKFGVTVAIIYGDTTPDGSLVVSASAPYVQPNRPLDFCATASNPSYIASAVFLDSSPTAGATLIASSTTLFDGPVTDLLHNPAAGYDVVLGDIVFGSSRSATWRAQWATEGWKTWWVDARSDNWVDKSAGVTIGVDGTPPGAPTNVGSSTHVVDAWTNNPNLQLDWSSPSDNLSGVDGFSWSLSEGSPDMPATNNSLTAAPLATTLPSTAIGWYVNVRAVDKAGNWGAPASVGLFKIDTVAPSASNGLASSTHVPGVASCSNSITMNWAAASDAHSGLAGYVGLWDSSPTTDPTGAVNVAAGATSFAASLPGSSASRYFHLRALDQAGNFGPTSHAGPYTIVSAPSTYCTAKVNSLGCVPAISFTGSPTTGGADDFILRASEVLNNKSGLVFWGTTPAASPFHGGTLCVAQPMVRTATQFSGGNPSGNDCSGRFAFAFTHAYMASSGLAAGSTAYAQYWYRDPGFASPNEFGLTEGLAFTLCQ